MIKLPDIYPKEWVPKLKMDTLDFIEFRNLTHFKTYVGKLTQKQNMKCDVSYAEAFSDLMNGTSQFTDETYMTIRNLVRSNLQKRGLITQEVYENYRYTVDGIIVDYDMGKYAAGEPDCVITPSVQYVDFFYELYVNISYRSGITNQTISANMNKMLATLEELQRQHINIKVTLVFPGERCNNENNFFSVIPLYSHREFKTASLMSSVLNDRLLRKFYFAILEDYYGDSLTALYGTPMMLPKTMNLGEPFDEIEFFKHIQECAMAGGE